jgi:hypothetical protein
MANKTIIGRAELIDLPDLGFISVPAKIDTGADSSAIWASQVTLRGNTLYCVFFGPGSSLYTGKIVKINDFTVTRVSNSFGQREMRYKVKLRIRVKGRLIRSTFTLSDRALKMYPMLLGRRLLNGKFLVDVSEGEPLVELETLRARKLQKELETFMQEGESV